MVTTSNIGTGANFALKRIVEDGIIRQFRKNVYFYDLADKRTLPNGAHTYAWNIANETSFTAADALLQEGVTPSYSAFGFRQVDFSMKQYGRPIELSDLVLKDSPVDVYAEAGWELGRKMAEIVDSAVQGALDGEGVAETGYIVATGANLSDKSTKGSVLYPTGVESRAEIDGTKIATASKLAEAMSLLENNAVPPIDGGYIALAHPFVVKDFLTEEGNGGFFEVSKYSQPENIFNGEIGKLYNIRIIKAPNIKKYAGAGVNGTHVYPTFIIGKSAYGIVESQSMETIIKTIGSSGSTDPLNQRATVACKIRFDAKILKGESLIRFETATSAGV